MSNINLIVKNENGILKGLTLETHTSFSKYASSLIKEKNLESVNKRIEGYSKYYGKKIQTFSEMPIEGNLFLFDVKTNSWLSLNQGKLVKVSEVIKHKQALNDAITSKRELITKTISETYNVTGDKLKTVVASLEASLLKNS